MWTPIVVAVLAGVGLVQSGSGFGALARGNLELANSEAYLLWWRLPGILLFWLALVISLMLLVAYLFIAYFVHRQHAGPHSWLKGMPLAVDLDELEQSVERIHLNRKQVDFYVTALVDPSSLFERIREVVEPEDGSAAASATYTVRVRQTKNGRLLALPLILSERSRIEDGLQIRGAAGDIVSSFSHLRAIAYAAAVIRDCVRRSGGTALAEYQGPTSEADTPSLERAVWYYLARAEDPNKLSKSDQKLDELKFSTVADKLLRLGAADTAHINRAFKVLFRLYGSYPITVAVDPGEAIRTPSGRVVRFETLRRITLPVQGLRWLQMLSYAFGDLWGGAVSIGRAFGVWRGRRLIGRYLWNRALAGAHVALTQLADTFRHWAGVRSNVFSYSLGGAERARGYHLEFKGPDDTYMARQRIENSLGLEVAREDLEKVEFSMSAAHGQRHSHIYVRNGGTQDERNGAPAASTLTYSVGYFERTPGSMAVAFVAAGTSLFISIILAMQEILSQPGVAEPDSGGLLEILLAFPLVAAAAGSLTPGRPVWGGVLAARIANVFTTLLTLLALWSSSLPGTFTTEARPKIWLAIVLGLAFVSVACLGSWWMRVLVQSHFVNSSKAMTK